MYHQATTIAKLELNQIYIKYIFLPFRHDSITAAGPQTSQQEGNYFESK